MDNHKTKPHILIVDDRHENLIALQALLDSMDVEIVTAASGNEALGIMLDQEFAMVLLDVQMPEMDGFEVAELMRKRDKTKVVPIIFVTAVSQSDTHIFKGYESGAVDFLFKPLEPIILQSKVAIFIELYRHKKELERNKQRIELQNEQLKELAIRDGLTGLYNHRYFHELMHRDFYQASRNNYDLSCFMIDLDYFKDVNDTFGHTFGDFVLRNFARLLRAGIRKTDILARYGGEEFVLLLPHTDIDGARILAEKFRKQAEKYVYHVERHHKKVTASIGIATFKAHHPKEPGDLITFADKALYAAKAEGRNRVKIYNEEALTESGALKSNHGDTDSLFGLHSHLNKLLDKTRNGVMAALDNIAQNPRTAEEPHLLFNKEHNNRTTEILDLMGERLGLPWAILQTFKRAARLHDLFKIFLKDETPLKEGPLSSNEQLNIEDYPIILEQLTLHFDLFSGERAILRHHHECYDGTGYPGGLEGAEIPLGARLFALVDAFVSMTSKRSYRPTLNPPQVINELVKQAGHQFDPMLVQHLLLLIEGKHLLSVPPGLIQAAQEELPR